MLELVGRTIIDGLNSVVDTLTSDEAYSSPVLKTVSHCSLPLCQSLPITWKVIHGVTQDGKLNTVMQESQTLANILAIVQIFFFETL